MNRIKYILRGTLLLLIVFLLIYLNGKTNDNIARIAKFKFDTFNKLKADSLDAEHKVDVLVDETQKFSEQISKDSPQIRDGMRYLITVVGILIAVEIVFFVAKRRRPGE
jgi:hypothetical protein